MSIGKVFQLALFNMKYVKWKGHRVQVTIIRSIRSPVVRIVV